MLSLTPEQQAELTGQVLWVAEYSQEWFYLSILGPVYLAKPQKGAAWYIIWYDTNEQRVIVHDSQLINVMALPSWLNLTQRLALLQAALTW